MFDGFGLVVTQVAVVAGAAALFDVVLGWILGGARERRRAERGARTRPQQAAPPPAAVTDPVPVQRVELPVPETAPVVVPFGGRRYAD